MDLSRRRVRAEAPPAEGDRQLGVLKIASGE
jgi:hypothetical protein